MTATSRRGADNIKAFFKDHAGVTDSWLDLIDMKIAFLTSLPGKVEDAGLSNSHVEESFLEHELTHALSKSKAIMEEQKRTWGPSSERSKASSRSNCFQPKAQIRSFLQLTKRSETIHKLGKLDHDLTKEYAETEANEQFIQADFQKLQNATGKGKVPRRFTTTLRRTVKATYIRKGDIARHSDAYLTIKRKKRKSVKSRI